MLHRVGKVGLVGGVGAGRLLTGPDYLNPLLTLTRSQASSIKSTALNSTAAAYVEYDADVARFNGVARRLLIEGSRANSIRNPRGEGAVAGVPGTAPTNWVVSTTGTGITREIVGSGTEDGLNYVDFKFSGTNSLGSTLQLVINGDANNTAVAAEGQIWTTSAFVKLAAGSLSGLTNIILVTRARNSGGTQISIASTTIVPTGAALSTQRFSIAHTMPALTAFSNSSITASMPNGAVVDFTLRVAGYQLELGAVASSPILPPLNAPAVATRGTDLVSSSLTNLGIGSNGACTILMVGMIPAQNTIAQCLVHVDDGTNNNRYLARLDASTNNLNLYRLNGGAGAGAVLIGAIVPGTPFRFGFSIDGTGRCIATLNGAATAVHTGGVTSGLTTLRIGIETSSFGPLFGEIGKLRILPYGLNDAQLRSRVLAFS